MSTLLALLACVSWGYSTHAASRGVKAWGALPLTAWSQLAGLLLLVPWALAAGQPPRGGYLFYGVLAGLGSGTSLALLYDACLRMPPGLAAAVSGVVAALVPLAATAITGSSPSALAALSLVPCVVGVTLVAAAQDRPASVSSRRAHFGVVEAALSGAAMGLYYGMIPLVHQPADAVAEARVTATLVLFAVVLTRATARPRIASVAVQSALLVGIAGSIGAIAYGYAVRISHLVSVVAIVSASPAITAALGRWRGAIRLSAVQICGLILCVAGAGLAAVNMIS